MPTVCGDLVLRRRRSPDLKRKLFTDLLYPVIQSRCEHLKALVNLDEVGNVHNCLPQPGACFTRLHAAEGLCSAEQLEESFMVPRVFKNYSWWSLPKDHLPLIQEAYLRNSLILESKEHVFFLLAALKCHFSNAVFTSKLTLVSVSFSGLSSSEGQREEQRQQRKNAARYTCLKQ